MADKKKLSEEESAHLRGKAEELFHKRMKKYSKNFGGMMPKETQELLGELQVHQIELEMQNEELERTQEELFYAKERYFELYDMAPVGYLTLNDECVILEANLTATTMLGTTRQALIRQPITNFVLSEDQDVCYLYHKRVVKDTPELCELRMRTQEGKIFWAELNTLATQDSEGRPIFRMIMNDVTARKKMEEELRLKDKMMLVQSRQAAMGEMISMIAHQWRQPLNIVGLAIANIEMKQMLKLLDETALQENLGIINKNIAFMSETIDDFRNFFRPDTPKELTSVEQVLKSTIEIIGKNLENNTIEIKLNSSSKSVLFISKSSLIQVFLNILSNARDALVAEAGAKALITIEISENAEGVVTSICDNAGGIPEALMEKIGQPYFTTKELNGTGLGIYMSKIVVEKHLNGTLTWHNDARGACFVITLMHDTSTQG